VLFGEGRGDTRGVGEQRVPALAGGMLAGEQQQAGRIGQAGPVGVRDQLGVGERSVSGVGRADVGDHGHAVGSGVAVRPDAHQPACHVGQRGTAGDTGEGHEAVLA
jgi:hypothetical protein